MPIPLIPIAAGVGAGMIGQGLLSMLGDDKKPSISTTTTTSTKSSDTYHAPFQQYQPTTLYAPTQSIVYPQYQIAIDSPKASQKMEATQRTDTNIRQQPTYDQPVQYPTQTTDQVGEAGAGITNQTIMLVALIAAGGLVAYGVLR